MKEFALRDICQNSLLKIRTLQLHLYNYEKLPDLFSHKASESGTQYYFTQSFPTKASLAALHLSFL